MRAGNIRTVAWRVVLLALLVVAAGLFVAHLEGGPGISDTGVYQRYGERIAAGDLPYRDFAVEYPPGALVPFVLPALLSETSGKYDTAFRALMLVSLAVIVIFLGIYPSPVLDLMNASLNSLSGILQHAGPATMIGAQ